MNLRESGKKRAAVVTVALGAASIIAAGATSAALWLNTPLSGSTSSSGSSATGSAGSSSAGSSSSGSSSSGSVSSGSGTSSHATTSGS